MKINDFGLINSAGEEWKELRSLISPIFSISKLKNMATAIDDVSVKSKALRQLIKIDVFTL